MLCHADVADVQYNSHTRAPPCPILPCHALLYSILQSIRPINPPPSLPFLFFFYSFPLPLSSHSLSHFNNSYPPNHAGAVVVKERDRNGKFYILNDGNAQMLKANKATGEKVAGK